MRFVGLEGQPTDLCDCTQRHRRLSRRATAVMRAGSALPGKTSQIPQAA